MTFAVVRGLDEACKLAKDHQEKGADGDPLEIWSEPAAALFLGALVFKEIIHAARRETDHPNLIGVLDCGDEVGAALNAIRHRVDAVHVRLAPDVTAKVQSIAEQAGVLWKDTRPDGR